jgi:endonuclease YncB( thermonuclease family)
LGIPQREVRRPCHGKAEMEFVKPRLAAVILIIAANPALAAKPHYEITGKVVAIADGDTLTVLDDAKTRHKIRLAGIDAPEKKQAFGTKAREALADRVFGKTVRVDVIDVDRYRREVGRIYFGDRFINLEMVREGMAWRYARFDRPGEFSAAETDAREHGRGLWSDPHRVPPWEFRRQKRESPNTK